MQGVSTRSVDELVKAMGMGGISKSQVSRLCEEIDGLSAPPTSLRGIGQSPMVKAFLERPIEGLAWAAPPGLTGRPASGLQANGPSSGWTRPT